MVAYKPPSPRSCAAVQRRRRAGVRGDSLYGTNVYGYAAGKPTGIPRRWLVDRVQPDFIMKTTPSRQLNSQSGQVWLCTLPGYPFRCSTARDRGTPDNNLYWLASMPQCTHSCSWCQ